MSEEEIMNIGRPFFESPRWPSDAIGFARAILAAAALKSEDARDTKRLDWLLKKRMLFAWVEIHDDGNYSCIRAQGTHNVVGIESEDPHAVIDAAMKEPNA
jgi:hypothetical protein